MSCFASSRPSNEAAAAARGCVGEGGRRARHGRAVHRHAALAFRNEPTAPFYYDLSYVSLAALAGFCTLFTLAIRHVRDRDYHRRLILFATIPLLPPDMNRTYQVLGQLGYLPVLATYLTMAVIAAALIVHDYRKNGRLSFASKVSGAIVFGQQLLHVPVTRSEAFADVMSFLVGEAGTMPDAARGTGTTNGDMMRTISAQVLRRSANVARNARLVFGEWRCKRIGRRRCMKYQSRDHRVLAIDPSPNAD